MFLTFIVVLGLGILGWGIFLLVAGTWAAMDDPIQQGTCGCLLVPVVLAVAIYGLWFSSRYPSWQSVLELLR